jgi:iron complex transport system ATP-binding protein
MSLSLSNLTAWHRGGPPVLREISLTAPRGQITALLGPNGAGKSTILKAALGLIDSTGTITLDGEDLRSISAADRARRVAWVPQRTALLAPLNCRAVVEQGRFVHRSPLQRPGQADKRAVNSALAQADVEHLEHRRFTELSGGEQQRVLLARALATGATTLLLDEPTSALDVRQMLAFHTVVRRLSADNHCIVMVLHELGEVLQHTDRAILLRDGRVAASGKTADIVAAGPIREVYGVELVEASSPSFRLPAEPR